MRLANTTATEQYVFSDKWVDIENTSPTQYTYSAWFKSDNPQAEIFLYMKDAAGVIIQVNTTNNIKGTWTPLTGTFTVPANVKKLCLRLDNAFKAPLQIEETNVDKISFTYNDDNNRSTVYYGGIDGDKMLRPLRKHYSADGSMEIKENIQTGKVEFVTYIGGTCYKAPIVFKSDGGSNQNYLYLHRDYQGSILAVTDSNGLIVEKRIFDSWGSIIKVQDGAGNSLNGLSVLDRGYTSHEHLQSVGLINMNARLYDPLLHRFLQVDNFIQDLTNTQNYNQYGYVFNNPNKFVDLTGNIADPPSGRNYDDGYEYSDEDGKWRYDAKNETWIGLDGTADITVGAINLPNITIGGENSGFGSSVNITPFSGITADVGVATGNNNLQRASLFDGQATVSDIINIALGITGYAISQVQSAAEIESNLLRNRNTLTSLTKLAKLETSILGANKLAFRLGIAGAVLTTGKVAIGYFNGNDLTAGQLFDIGIAVGFAAITVSNPIGLVGLGVYGLLDATGALDTIKSSLGGDTVVLKSNFGK